MEKIKWEGKFGYGIANPISMAKPAECPYCEGVNIEILELELFRCKDCSGEIILIQEE